MFPKKSKEKITKMDVLITSVVLGTIVAGAFGLKKRSNVADPDKVPLWRRILRKIVGK